MDLGINTYVNLNLFMQLIITFFDTGMFSIMTFPETLKNTFTVLDGQGEQGEFLTVWVIFIYFLCVGVVCDALLVSIK